jgi:hypothetical protein
MYGQQYEDFFNFVLVIYKSNIKFNGISLYVVPMHSLRFYSSSSFAMSHTSLCLLNNFIGSS